MNWKDLPPRPEARGTSGRVALVRLLLPLAAAGALAVTGHRPLAVVVGATATVIALVSRWWPETGHHITGALAAVGHGVAAVVSWVLLGLVEVLILTPLALIARLLGRDPLTGAVGPGTRWSVRDGRVSSRHTFGPEGLTRRPAGRVSHVLGLVPRVVGALVLILLANYAAGWLYDEYFGSHDEPADSGAVSSAGLADAPAMADEAWAEAYWAEFDALDHDFHPFLLTRVADVDGDNITSDGGVRRSHQPGAAAPIEVWFFGGGALWGEGQRDGHTIPSEVARRAEADGRAVRVVNFGQPGYTTWQSALLFEQELAVRPAPDLAVFYDGADDVAVQIDERTTAPSHYNAAGAAVALTGRDSAADQARDLWEEYRDTSVLTRLAEGLGGLFGVQPAAADEDGDLADTVADLRSRSRAVLESVAEDRGVEVLVAWQAATGVAGDDGAYRRAETTAGELDLRATLDAVADDVYLDGVLTDEDGARLVAEALWPLIADELG